MNKTSSVIFYIFILSIFLLICIPGFIINAGGSEESKPQIISSDCKSDSPDQPLKTPYFHPVGHSLEGLPTTSSPQPVYDADPQHPLNKLHNLLFVSTLIPTEIQSELPAERLNDKRTPEEYFVKGWYFEKRAGTDSDLKTFGGDVRVSPVDTLSPESTAELDQLLDKLQKPEDIQQFPVLENHLARVLLQWDLLTSWWNLEKKKYDNDKLLLKFSKAIMALALTDDQLHKLPSGLTELHHIFPASASINKSQHYLPADFPPDSHTPDSDWIEIGRNSSALFRADRSLKSTRVFLKTSSPQESKKIISEAANPDIKPESISIPPQTQTGFVQNLIAITPDLKPVVTPVIDEVRVRTLTPPFAITADHPSSSRDGSTHFIYLRTRAGTALGHSPVFRFVPDTHQSLFLEYGTLKHATYAAQCALCHRLSNNGGQTVAGIRSLSHFAKPHVAKIDERKQIAQLEMAIVTRQLQLRLNQENNTTPVSKARPEKSPEERTRLAAELRDLYSRPAEFWPAPHVDPGVNWQEIGLLPTVQHPTDNPDSKAKQLLGYTLFFDPRISGSKQIACASCHDPDLGWADGRTTSFGHTRKHLARNAPSVRNSAFYSNLFWDGRAKSLEDQAEMVLLNPDEMNSSPVDVVDILTKEKGYTDLFKQAFGDQEITMDRITKALACFERTIVGGNSRFDAFLKGNTKALDDSQILGLDLYRREARCLNCHNGPLFSDSQFHEVGLSYYGRLFEDLGRYRFTDKPEDSGKFRTPSLRDITTTTPLMHNGLFELKGVLNMYNAGMPTLRKKPHQQNDINFPVKSPLLKPLHLNQQDLEDLQAFLEALEEPKRRIFPPTIPGLAEKKIKSLEPVETD